MATLNSPTIIIDGYNVIRRDPALARAERVSLENGRDALVLQLAARYHPRDRRIVVVFDGAGTRETREQRIGITIVFTAERHSADARIVELAREACQRGETAVVATDDGEIRAALGALAPGVTPASATALGESLRAAPRSIEKQARHRAAVRQRMERDANPDAVPPDRRGNPRRQPRRRR